MVKNHKITKSIDKKLTKLHKNDIIMSLNFGAERT